MFTVLDTETTGLKDPEVCQIAWIRLDANLRVLQMHDSLVDPGKPIDQGATAVHGITDDMVRGRPSMSEIAKGFNTEDCLIAHNAPFDARVIKKHAVFKAVFCTLKASRKWVKDCENHKLTTLARHLGFPEFEAHSASGDVQTCFLLVQRLIEISGLTINELVADTLRDAPVHCIPFGKHKGKPLAKLPADYRAWLLTQEGLDPGLRATLNQLQGI